MTLIHTQRAMTLASNFFLFVQRDIRFVKQIRFMEQIIVLDLFLGTRVKIMNPLDNVKLVNARYINIVEYDFSFSRPTSRY